MIRSSLPCSVLAFLLLTVCANSLGQDLPAPASSGSAIIEESTGQIRFGNSRAALVLDASTGYFRDIVNVQTGFHHKANPNSGSWPCMMTLGTPRQPELRRVQIGAGDLHPQSMTHQVRNAPDGTTLVMDYPNLVSTGGTPSGVHLIVNITLKNDADYYLITFKMENRGDYEITNFHCGGSDLIADASPENEMLAVPAWSFGDLWANPASQIKRRETYGYPIFGSKGGLIAGWMDLYGSQGGIGTGYLNRKGLSMLFNLWLAGRGLHMGWNLFNLEHDMASAIWGMVQTVHGVKPGKSFETDSWILAVHEGDWHRMADIYRAEYDRYFAGDFLNWEQTSSQAKEIDIITNYVVQELRSDPPIRKSFRNVAPYVDRVLMETGVDPENLAIYVQGTSRHFPLYMPDFLPCSEEAGGEEACRKMLDYLNKKGIKTLFYNHLFYNHPQAKDYVAAADTGVDHFNSLWKDIGNVACIEHPEWQNLWREKYIPGYKDLGVQGMWLDQGSVHYMVCETESHGHGPAPEAVLGSPVRGVLNIIKTFREVYGEEKPPFFWTEVGSDVQARTLDIWTCPPFSYGGRCQRAPEMVRYACPGRLSVYQPQRHPGSDGQVPDIAMSFNEALINGFALQIREEMLESVAAKEALKQFIRIRQELRKSEAPGFPQGFRDQVGLTAGSPLIRARAYRDERGVTVVYYGKEAVECEIQVHPKALDFGSDVVTIPVKLQANEAGYQIIK